MKKRILFVGESHSMAIASALAARTDPDSAASVLDVRPFRPLVDSESGAPRFGDALTAAIDDAVTPGMLVVSCIGGNQHSILSLVAQPQPFDLRLAAHPDLPLDESAWLIPEAEMRAVLEARLERELLAIKLLRKQVGRRIIHAEGPPPLADEDKIMASRETIFVQKGVRELGVAPRHVRRKIWLLQRDIISRFCTLAGISYVPLPDHVFDEDGLLHRQGYGRDATHGNSWFGEQVVAEVERVIALRRPSTATAD